MVWFILNKISIPSYSPFENTPGNGISINFYAHSILSLNEQNVGKNMHNIPDILAIIQIQKLTLRFAYLKV